MKKVIGFIVCMLLISVCLAQDSPKPEVSEVKDLPGVILIIKSSDIRDILVVKSNGEWVSDAKEISIWSDVGRYDRKSVCTCNIWRGVYRPRTPKQQVWPVDNVIMTSDEEFDETLNKMQSDTPLEPQLRKVPKKVEQPQAQPQPQPLVKPILEEKLERKPEEDD